MAGDNLDSLTDEQSLRLTIQKDVRSICQETTHYVGMDIDSNVMELIGELVWKKIQVFGSDLECFAKHAKRSTINSEDVKLLVRRNPSLLAHITKLADENTSSTTKRTKDTKRKKTNASDTTNPTANESKSATVTSEPSTSSAVPMKIDQMETNDSESEDSPFIRMLHKKISDRNVNKENDEDVIDLSD